MNTASATVAVTFLAHISFSELATTAAAAAEAPTDFGDRNNRYAVALDGFGEYGFCRGAQSESFGEPLNERLAQRLVGILGMVVTHRTHSTNDANRSRRS